MTNWRDRLALTAQRNRQEIVRDKLSRREMIRLGLMTAGGSLALKKGLSARAFADDGSLTFVKGVDGPPSPLARPFVQEMPRLPVLNPSDPNHLVRGGVPTPFTVINGATQRYQQQLFGKFPPQKYYELSMKQAEVQVHPDYGTTTIWGFNGQVPGPLIRAKYGEPVLVRYYNDLPSVKKPAPQGFGIAEITTHLHNGHTPFESDGNPVDFINSINDPNTLNPLGFKDNHYPNVYAGYSTFGGIGNSDEALGSLWYHDHHLDFTSQNVYKGMFGCYNLFDHIDSNNEQDQTPGALRLPSGEFDVPIFFNDFLFDQDFKLVFDLFDLDGILGDRFAVNGAIQPKMTVSKRRYRLRLYNPGPSRWYEFYLTDGKSFFPFWQLSTDGNLLPNAVKVQSVRLSVAERADIVIDFNSPLLGATTRLFLVNRLEQVNGRGPTGNLVAGTSILRFDIGPKVDDPSNSGLAITAQSPVVGIHLRDLPDTDAQLAAAVAKAPVRTFRFERGNGAWTVNGQFFDENVINANPSPDAEEVWVIQNPGGGWRHPIHMHFEEHRTLTQDGSAVRPNVQANGTIDYARRDVIPLNENNEVRTFIRLRDMQGRYVMHCHNVVHEDHAMMVRIDIGKIPTPITS
jgi:FtsP/CotA-like multicopper oxidase with cupredoxin domain